MRLADLYPKLNAEERASLAKQCDTSPAYLWQLSARWRGRKPSVDMLLKLAAADKRLKAADLLAEFGETAA